MNKNIRFFSIFILGFSVYYLFDLYCFKSIQNFSKNIFQSKAIAHVTAYSLTLLPLLITLKVLLPEKNITDLLSLDKPIIKGFTLSFTGTLPMILGYSLHFNLLSKVDFESLFINTISSAFFEEIIFRAFLIGILFRFSRLGFLSSVLFGSLLFAQVHLYQSQNTTELFEIFAITLAGSIFFAWVYFENEFNLWTAIFLHFFMNLYWELFTVSGNVSGNLYGNLYKIISIIQIMLITVYCKRRKNIPYQISRKSLFIKTKQVQS
ncbi:MAG: CPBP family intramembrane metalloprotease [Chryseobacterium sp.]|uniref:CPBP family intramembrane glutamic endopeptidase n=1 Tax=Chryseobacterium sp. TaxID=1871047 RepID=UPI0025C5240B|nr:CPBP family intramembrane glutamic endopeptidase [Chryseobacterium sp.]MCJ7934400.1 CPBP family intramembrane metalloprotease [Chryseobacterium sp.]